MRRVFRSVFANGVIDGALEEESRRAIVIGAVVYVYAYDSFSHPTVLSVIRNELYRAVRASTISYVLFIGF